MSNPGNLELFAAAMTGIMAFATILGAVAAIYSALSARALHPKVESLKETVITTVNGGLAEVRRQADEAGYIRGRAEQKAAVEDKKAEQER